MRKIIAMIVFLLICLLILYTPMNCFAFQEDHYKPDTYSTDYTVDGVEYTKDGRQIKSMNFMLVYDPVTRIVYYKTASMYLPYISEYGTYTAYKNGMLTPIGR